MLSSPIAHVNKTKWLEFIRFIQQSFALVAQNGNIYYGLWYPIIVAAGTLVIGILFVKETKDIDIYARD